MKTIPSFLIVADRGHLIAYSYDPQSHGSTPHMVAEVCFSEGGGRLADQLTDQAGAFPAGETQGHGNAAAERMTLSEELDLQAVRRIAKCVDHLLERHHASDWGLAAPAEINAVILERVSQKYTDRLSINLARDLTKIPADEIVEHLPAD